MCVDAFECLFHLSCWEAVWERRAAVALITSLQHTRTHACSHTQLLPTPNSQRRTTATKTPSECIALLFNCRDELLSLCRFSAHPRSHAQKPECGSCVACHSRLQMSPPTSTPKHAPSIYVTWARRVWFLLHASRPRFKISQRQVKERKI